MSVALHKTGMWGLAICSLIWGTAFFIGTKHNNRPRRGGISYKRYFRDKILLGMFRGYSKGVNTLPAATAVHCLSRLAEFGMLNEVWCTFNCLRTEDVGAGSNKMLSCQVKCGTLSGGIADRNAHLPASFQPSAKDQGAAGRLWNDFNESLLPVGWCIEKDCWFAATLSVNFIDWSRLLVWRIIHYCDHPFYRLRANRLDLG